MSEIMTARELRDSLAARGVVGAAADLILARTAHARHLARVESAAHEALAWAVKHVAPTGAAAYASAWLACVLDAHGVGGAQGVEGAGTTRHPAFAAVAATKQSGPGAAWTAAIADAARRLQRQGWEALDVPEALRTRFTIGLDSDGDLVVVSSGFAADAAGHVVTVLSGYGAPRDAEWRRALLGARLLDVIGAPPAASAVPWCACEDCAQPARVALAFNAACEELERERARRNALARALPCPCLTHIDAALDAEDAAEHARFKAVLDAAAN